MKKLRLFNFKYPKLMVLAICIILAYLLFRKPEISNIMNHLGILGYFGTFIAGLLFAFGFSAPFAAGFFITLNPGNLWIAGILGGLGALVADMLIFKFIRFSFEKEFTKLKQSYISRKIKHLVEISLGKRIGLYLMYVFAGFLIASPLPDEAGIIMFAGLTKVKQSVLAIISFILNTLGIIILLSI